MGTSDTTDTIIIGAGMAGLACASTLQDAGREVRLLDKGRGPGGRMATRRVELGNQQLRFDHGAQYFTARDPAFQAAVEAWHAEGATAPWPAAGDDAWVGSPSMNAPIKHMAERLDVNWATRVETVSQTSGGWTITTADETAHCSNLLIAIPPEQVSELLAEPASDLAALAAEVRSQPCWAVLVHFASKLPFAADTFRSEGGAIGWAARNGAKPGRDGGESWVIHASPARSEQLLELDKESVAEILLGDFFAGLGIGAQEPRYLTAHRWRYAMPQVQSDSAAIWRRDTRIGLAGDWLHSPRVEGAFLSGRALAEAVLAS